MRNYDNLGCPKLIAAARELEEVLHKHELMGMVFFASQERGGFVLHLSPPWSCVFMNGDEIRIRAKREDFKTQDEQAKVITDAMHGMGTMLSSSRKVFEGVEGLMMMVRSRVKVRQRETDFRGKAVKIQPDDPPPEDA